MIEEKKLWQAVVAEHKGPFKATKSQKPAPKMRGSTDIRVENSINSTARHTTTTCDLWCPPVYPSRVLRVTTKVSIIVVPRLQVVRNQRTERVLLECASYLGRIFETMSNTEDEENDWFGQSLRDFDLYGWKADPRISYDDNVMDLVMLLTRSSKCKQGSMACILMRPRLSSENYEESLSKSIRDSIISVATNRALFNAKSSDVHAEICALGSAARTGSTTDGCTAYITMPPCRVCLGALVAAGVKRIASRMKCRHTFMAAAEKLGVEFVVLGGIQEQTARINTLIHGNPNGKKRDAPRTEEDNGAKKQK